MHRASCIVRCVSLAKYQCSEKCILMRTKSHAHHHHPLHVERESMAVQGILAEKPRPQRLSTGAQSETTASSARKVSGVDIVNQMRDHDLHAREYNLGAGICQGSLRLQSQHLLQNIWTSQSTPHFMPPHSSSISHLCSNPAALSGR
jgi:hypothetical protein